MKRNEKIVIGILVVITIIVIIFAVTKRNNNDNQKENQQSQQTNQQENQLQGEFVANLDNGVAYNTSNKLEETKTFEGLEISNIQLTKEGNTSQILATVTNKSNEAKPFQILKFKFVDKENNEIITISCAIKDLATDESTQLSTNASFDYVNAYDFVII